MTIDFKERDYAIDLDARGKEQRFEQIEVTSRTPSLDRVSITKPMSILLSGSITIEGSIPGAASSTFTEKPTFVWLDTVYPQILPGSWIVLDRPTPLVSATGLSSSRIVARARTVSTLSRSEYGIAAKATLIELDRPWINLKNDHFSVIRETAVYAQCDDLPLAEEPFDPILEAVCGNEIELSRMVDGLQPGRLVIVSGVRTDVGQLDAQGKVTVRVPGVPAAELAMLAGVTQGGERKPESRRHDHPPARRADPYDAHPGANRWPTATSATRSPSTATSCTPPTARPAPRCWAAATAAKALQTFTAQAAAPHLCLGADAVRHREHAPGAGQRRPLARSGEPGRPRVPPTAATPCARTTAGRPPSSSATACAARGCPRGRRTCGRSTAAASAGEATSRPARSASSPPGRWGSKR